MFKILNDCLKESYLSDTYVGMWEYNFMGKRIASL